MSTLLEQASLVMIPSGYKEDVVYSQIPTSGAGDLSFTRASNGTRINSAGLVEVCPWNLLTYSEDFTTTWVQNVITIGGNSATAPNGTTTADSFTSNATSANHVAYQLLTGVSGAYTFSAYVKKANSRYVYLKLVGDASQWVAAVFDLNDGTLTKSEATGWTGLTASSESVGNGWYRLIVSGSGATSANFNVGIQYTNTGTPTFSAYADASFTGTGTIDYYIWGAQLNIGSTAKPYFPTTDRLNVPRLTYQNGGGGCPSLLLEKQSTNLLTYSEQFDNVLWSKSNTNVTANSTTSPDGTQNADRMFETVSTNNYGFYQFQTLSTGTNYALSCYVKKGNRDYCGLQFWYDSYNGAIAFFNLANGTLVYEFAEGSGYSVTNSKIEDVGNGWYRLSGIFQTGNAGSYPGLVMASTQWSTGTSYDNNYVGDATKYIEIWGAQLEASSYPTSYIPTTSSSATRVADACSKTGISSLIGGGVGTWFMDFEMVQGAGSGNPFAFDLSDGTTSNRLYLYWNESVQSWYWGGADTGITLPSTLRKKIAVKFSGTTAKLFCNGISIATNTIATAFNRLDIGQRFSNQYPMDGKINEAFFLTTSLPDAECQALTTI